LHNEKKKKMSEEQVNTEAQVQAGQEQQSQAQPQVQEQQEFQQRPLPGILDIMFGDKAQDVVNQVQPQSEERGQEAQTNETTTQQVANESSGEQSTGEEQNDPLVIKSPIFGDEGYKIKSDEEEAPRGVNIAEVEKVYKDFGFETPDEFKSALDFYKTQKPELEKVKQEHEYVLELLGKAPKELHQALVDFSEGKDWTQAVKNIRPFDITKQAEQQDAKNLVEYYLPGKFSQEEWEEYTSPDGDPTVKKAIDLSIDIAKRELQKEQDQIQSKANEAVQQAQQRMQAFEQSVETATQNLSKKFEGIDKRYVEKVTEELKSQTFMSLFYNPDGTLKPEAGERVIMAQHGYDLMRQFQHAAAVKARNEERTEILSRGAERPTARQQQNSSKELRPEEAKQVQFYESLLTKKKTF
jgi:hypothetical protein